MKLDKLTGLLFAALLVASPRIHGQEALEQEKISIRGNQALPKTMFIAPWKRLGAPLEGKALQSSVPEKLDPVERELFRRELKLHREGYSLD